MNFVNCIHENQLLFRHKTNGTVITRFCMRTLQQIFGVTGLIDFLIEKCSWPIEQQQVYEHNQPTALNDVGDNCNAETPTDQQLILTEDTNEDLMMEIAESPYQYDDEDQYECEGDEEVTEMDYDADD